MNDNRIKYDKLVYGSGPVKFSDYVSNKMDIIHEELFAEALHEWWLRHKDITDKNGNKKYEETFNKFLSENKIIELKNKEYHLPSSVIISSKKFPYTQEKVSLNEYWNKYQFNENNKDISQLISDEDSINDATIVYINYVTGKCKFRSKLTGREFWTTIDYINSNTKINKDEMTLKDTFGQLLKNKRK